MPRGSSKTKGTFLDLYERTARRLLAYLARRMQDLDAATDLWSECWAVAFESWPRCRANGIVQEDAWIFGIARNLLRSYYRSGAIEGRALERLNWSTPAFDAVVDEELARIVELDLLRTALTEALAGLPAKRRRAIRLRIVDGLSYAEVATVIGCSEDAARAHVSRGLRRLAATLERDDLLDPGGSPS